jgi:hypothetical protein
VADGQGNTEWIMQTYDQLVEIARICLRQARMAGAAEVVKELRRMAWEYREKAAN